MTDMLRSGELPMYMLVLPIVHFIVLIGIMALAKEKNRSKLTAFILGMIPFFNTFVLLVYVGLPVKQHRGA